MCLEISTKRRQRTSWLVKRLCGFESHLPRLYGEVAKLVNALVLDTRNMVKNGKSLPEQSESGLIPYTTVNKGVLKLPRQIDVQRKSHVIP